MLDRILLDKQNLSSVQQSMERDFLLKLSTGYIYSTLEHAIRGFDGNAFRKQVLEQFSGTLCIDEIYLGGHIVLMASDPISDNPIGCTIASRNDAQHMRRFMQNLKNRGFEPQTVVSDRSNLYPGTLELVWPEAQHQLCVFHVIAELNKLVLKAVAAVRSELKPEKLKSGAGRPKEKQRHTARAKKIKQQRRQTKMLFRHRYLFVSKRSNLTTSQKKTLDQLLTYSPVLKTLRNFTDDVYRMLSLRRSTQKAWKIWRRIRCVKKYLQNSWLAKAVKIFSKENVNKLLPYLDQPLELRTKVRTNNHVERCNRKIRYLEKVRYKWRRPKTIIRHILLQFQIWVSTTKIQPENKLL